MCSIHRALRPDGTLYVSVKFGEETTTKGDRSFTNYTLEGLEELFERSGFNILKSDFSYDVRPGREKEKMSKCDWKKSTERP